MSLAKNNTQAFTIMKLMGHKNIRTSQGYIERAGLDISDKVETINPLANLAGKNFKVYKPQGRKITL